MQDYLIVANGPFLKKAIIQEAAVNKRVIALDGAANSLLAIGMHPHIICGDFDSIDAATKSFYKITPPSLSQKPYLGHNNTLIVPALDQNLTDLEKAIQYCDQNGARNISITCATGGRLDHYEALRLALKTYYHVDRRIVVHDTYGSMCYAEDKELFLHGLAADNCGFVAYDRCAVNSVGLEYECINQNKSIANKMLAEKASLKIQGTALIFLPPELQAQRK